MNLPARSEVRVLAIDPTTRGFGFAVFEGVERLIDWGVVSVAADRNARCLTRLAGLLRRYTPDLLVVEDHTSRGCRRWRRIRDLLHRVHSIAREHGTKTRRISAAGVRRVFADLDTTTKHEIAGALASRYPELVPWLPPRRKPWDSEDERMGIFDAAAFAVAYFESQMEPTQPGDPA